MARADNRASIPVDDWDQVQLEIEGLLAETAAEIRAYPSPIPACDAQFNYLLDLRRGPPEELRRLETLRRDDTRKVADFMTSSPFGPDLARRILK